MKSDGPQPVPLGDALSGGPHWTQPPRPAAPVALPAGLERLPVLAQEATRDGIPTLWLTREHARDTLRWLKHEASPRYEMLYDLTAVDERSRKPAPPNWPRPPREEFTVVYHLFSFGRNEYLRLKVPLRDADLHLDSVTSIWPSANWYECECYDMFGVRFDGHPHLRRLLMPRSWNGHPLRKEHPARATEMGPFRLWEEKVDQEQATLHFNPEDWGMQRSAGDTDFMFLNIGPQHPGTHGVLRLALQLDGETIVDVVPDIGYHHRGAEKMGERQTWHTYIPYTDRIDYLAGVMNNFAYLMAVEKLGGIEIPPRAQVIRIMTAELFRIISHLVWYGTFAQDLGQLSPVFFTFNDRERAFGLIEAICGARMHPNWFRIGGVAQDLPHGWDTMMRDFLNYFPKRLKEYDHEVMGNRIFKARTQGVGKMSVADAIDWGVTGPNLRASGLEWDFRKKQPYGGYEQFDFDIPTSQRGDCYGRAEVRVEEMRQSMRIIDQCMKIMPDGPYKSSDPRATPPLKERSGAPTGEGRGGTMHDIETLITHFLGVSWGPVMPEGEALGAIEATKGNNGYYLTSDGSGHSYRTRVRTPSFVNMQTLPLLCRGHMIPDLLAVLGAMDFVLADIDR
ncbi:MAG: NADH-quinone oxidoreductase subunit C/D [Acidobacteria bacterium]|nr:MAG: NADH-quinone oxidoreductase subunit C/D [Acidobacteriota bacterium]